MALQGSLPRRAARQRERLACANAALALLALAALTASPAAAQTAAPVQLAAPVQTAAQTASAAAHGSQTGQAGSGPAAQSPASSGQSPAPPSQSAGAEPAQQLEVWTTYQGAALAWLRNEAASFEADFGKHVRVVPLSLGEIKQRAAVGAEKGQAADLFVGVPQDQFSALADAGILADMDAYATPRYLASLSRQARLAFEYGGKLYGLPLTVQGPALIVNTGLVSHLPHTYEGLLSLAASLTADGTYGFAFDARNFYYAYAWIHSYGGFVFGSGSQGAPASHDVGLAGAAAVKGAEALRSFVLSGSMPEKMEYDAVRKLFLSGKVAMTYDGPWAIPAILAAGIQVEVAPMPPLADGAPFSGFMNVSAVLLNRYGRDKVGAANLAKWLTTAGAQAALARQAGLVPASTSALAQLQTDPIISGFGAALADAEAIPNVPAMGSVWGPMDQALGTILSGPDSDVQAALQEAVSAIRGH